MQMIDALFGAGAIHLSKGSILLNWGVTLFELGKLEEAECKFEICCRMIQEMQGPQRKQPDIVRALNSLGMVFIEQGRFEQAKAVLDESLRMKNESWGCDTGQPEFFSTRINQAVLASEQGRRAEASFVLKRCLLQERLTLGNNTVNSTIATILRNLVRSLASNGG